MRWVAIIAAALLAAACGLVSGGVESRAVAYYNYRAGRSPRTPYSSFLSPAYRATFEREALETLDSAMHHGDAVNERFPPATAKDVYISVGGGFAYSAVNPDLGRVYRNLEPVRWVKAGLRWYLYFGSEAEVAAYGMFPLDLKLPAADSGPVEEEDASGEAEIAEQSPPGSTQIE